MHAHVRTQMHPCTHEWTHMHTHAQAQTHTIVHMHAGHVTPQAFCCAVRAGFARWKQGFCLGRRRLILGTINELMLRETTSTNPLCRVKYRASAAAEIIQPHYPLPSAHARTAMHRYSIRASLLLKAVLSLHWRLGSKIQLDARSMGGKRKGPCK